MKLGQKTELFHNEQYPTVYLTHYSFSHRVTHIEGGFRAFKEENSEVSPDL